MFTVYRRKHSKRPTLSGLMNLAGLLLLGLVALASTSCKSTQHEVTRRTEPNLDPGWPRGNNFFHQVSYQEVKGQIPVVQGAEYVNDDELCMQCHEAYVKSFVHNVHRGDSCESCHGPASRHLETQGREPGLIFSFKKGDPVARAEACLKCHEQNQCAAGTQWRTSRHAHCGITCVECHRAHYNVPPGTPATTQPGQTQRLPAVPIIQTGFQNAAYSAMQDAGQGYVKPTKNLPSLRGTSQNLGAVAPGICYRCHCDMREFQEVAGPHQICGPNGFNCTTCHNPHGQIRQETRKDLCLQCHGDNAPTMAWHSSTHDQHGVACTDCHNPHPRTAVPAFVNISHTNVTRPKRLQMSVQEPETCYKCHQKIFGLLNLPSHHPIIEGKMVCSDCHDPHGQREKNLKAETLNLVCYKCHAEKQGPHVYEHPPVTENCAICHEPHGTVANNLLRQPTTFLCLRCHDGHRGSHGTGNRNNIDTRSYLQQAFYTDCTQCHTSIHGTDQRGSSVTHDFNRF